MSSCILCLKPTKRSKITLNELIIDKTVKEVIIEQFSNHELILTGSSSASQAICPTCCKHFKDFYNFKKDINQKLSEVAVKVEEVPVDFVNFVLIEEPVLDYDLKQLEIKTEPKDIEAKVEDDSDFEWKLERECETPQKNSKIRKRKASNDDSDFDLATEQKRLKKVTKQGRPPKSSDDARIKTFCDLKCHECNTPMDSFKDLHTHFKSNHPKVEKYLLCCGKKFTRYNRLLGHINRVHDKIFEFKCEICNKIFNTNENLGKHRKLVHEGRKRTPKNETFVCNQCGKVCSNKTSFMYHMQSHEDEGKTFECFKCHSTFKISSTLKNHLREKHTKKPEKKFCKKCQNYFSIDSFNDHKKKFHTEVEAEKEQCKICGNFLLKSSMKDHMKKHSDPGVTCDVCGKFLKSKDSLSKHKKHYHSDIEPRFQCSYCDRKFHIEIKLREHTAGAHTKEILFRCRVPGCGKGFRAEGNWKVHEKRMHPEEYEKYFKPFYKRGPNEVIHNVNELTENFVNYSDQGVTCDICGQYVRKSSWLDKHKRDFHSGKEPRFSCTYCDAKFTQEQKWREHTAAQHTKEFLYICRVEGCGRGFSAKSSLKRHEATAHPKEYERLSERSSSKVEEMMDDEFY